MQSRKSFLHHRSYSDERTNTHQIIDVKHQQARVVLRSGTTREGRVAMVHILFFFCRPKFGSSPRPLDHGAVRGRPRRGTRARSCASVASGRAARAPAAAHASSTRARRPRARAIRPALATRGAPRRRGAVMPARGIPGHSWWQGCPRAPGTALADTHSTQRHSSTAAGEPSQRRDTRLTVSHHTAAPQSQTHRHTRHGRAPPGRPRCPPRAPRRARAAPWSALHCAFPAAATATRAPARPPPPPARARARVARAVCPRRGARPPKLSPPPSPPPAATQRMTRRRPS